MLLVLLHGVSLVVLSTAWGQALVQACVSVLYNTVCRAQHRVRGECCVVLLCSYHGKRTWMTPSMDPRMVSTAWVRVFSVGSPSLSMNRSMGSGVMKTCIRTNRLVALGFQQRLSCRKSHL